MNNTFINRRLSDASRAEDLENSIREALKSPLLPLSLRKETLDAATVLANRYGYYIKGHSRKAICRLADCLADVQRKARQLAVEAGM